MSRAPWQLLPDLTDEEYERLKASIAATGIHVPIVVDAETGAIVDGHHRARAWGELRARGTRVPDYPRDVRRFRSDEERAEAVLTLNLDRRHLSRSQRADVVRTLRQRGWSLRRIGGALGVGDATVRRDLDEIAPDDAISLPPRVERLGGGSYPARRPAPSLLVRSRRDEDRARTALSALRPDAPSPSSLLRAEERARMATLARRREAGVPAASVGPSWEVRNGDFREVLGDLEDQSVDAIVCDPPYDAAGVELFDDLGGFAARVLRPGRLLVAYVGKQQFPEEVQALQRHLAWVWCGAVHLPGRHRAIRDRMIRSRWRPVVMLSAGPFRPRTWMLDTFSAEGVGEKQVGDHHWQQAVGPFVRLIEQSTEPGELVVDPFVGGGTTGLAALRAGRRFLGCDLDAGAVSLSTERLEQAESPDGQKDPA